MHAMASFPGVLLALVFFLDAGVARADVPLPGTQPEDFQDPNLAYAALEPPSTCSTCHGAYDALQRIEPWDSYMGTPMGAAAIDPIFLAALSIADVDVSGVGDLCLRCHTPDAWLQGRSEPTDGSALLAGDEGLSCHFCHRVVDTDPTGRDGNAPYIGNGQFFLSPNDIRLGPFDDADAAPHDWAQSTYLTSSEFCGLCHEVSNPLLPWLAEDGTELGPQFPVERTYSEWLRSDFAIEGTTCQSCHMPALAGKTCQQGRAPERPAVPTHVMMGGNHWLPQALANLYPGDLDRVATWNDSTAAAQELLRGAASVALEDLPATVEQGTALAFSVRVTNETGHRLPTGYPEGRRMWLEVIVTDAAGSPVLSSGSYDLANDQRLDDAQLRAYEVELGIAGQGPSLHFVLNDVILLDTRIPPRGYAPLAGDSGLEPVGRDYGDGQGGYRHWDLAPYRAAIACDAVGPLQVTVRLLQQSASPEYIQFLQDEQSTVLGVQRAATLADVWDQTGRIAPFVMAELQGTVDLVGPCAPPDAGVDAAVGVDGGPGPGIDGGALPDSGPGPGIDAGAVPDSGAGPGVDAGTVDAGEGRDHASDGGCCSVAPGAGRDDSRALAVGGLLLACLLPRRRRRA